MKSKNSITGSGSERMVLDVKSSPLWFNLTVSGSRTIFFQDNNYIHVQSFINLIENVNNPNMLD